MQCSTKRVTFLHYLNLRLRKVFSNITIINTNDVFFATGSIQIKLSFEFN